VTPAALVGFTGASLAIAAIVGLASRHFELAASSLSVIRTVVICAVALALGFLSSLQRRIELAWLAYAAVALGTLKLLMEDLRFGNAASLVVSLLFYGLILILLPRVTKRRESA
jgi:chromate transport protein ChrA